MWLSSAYGEHSPVGQTSGPFLSLGGHTAALMDRCSHGLHLPEQATQWYEEPSGQSRPWSSRATGATAQGLVQMAF